MAISRQPKADAAKRRVYWQQQVEAQQRSGLSQAAFCAERGLRKGTLGFWRWKLAQEARAASRAASTGSRRASAVPAFIPVQLAARPTAGDALAAATVVNGMEIELMVGPAHRLRVRGPVDAAWLVQVLRGLEPATC